MILLAEHELPCVHFDLGFPQVMQIFAFSRAIFLAFPERPLMNDKVFAGVSLIWLACNFVLFWCCLSNNIVVFLCHHGFVGMQCGSCLGYVY